MTILLKSNRLAHVSYEIRGEVMSQAKKMEEEGHSITKLNIGNLGHFGFEPPHEIVQDVMKNMQISASYSDSKGLFASREAIAWEMRRKGVQDVSVDDVYIGNGASELIAMSLSALLNPGDEVLIPSPDYPLWTSCVSLSGGKPIHYLCDEKANWTPDLNDMDKKINENTKAIVIINPNNPTGALYSIDILKGILEIAKRHGLLVLADEVYEKILYDEVKHTAIASLSDEVLCLTFNSLSKNYRACGYRAGWMVISGPKKPALDFIEGLDTLASMRLCSNTLGQIAIQSALTKFQNIQLHQRLGNQRHIAYDMLSSIPGVTCVKPQGALYLFPKLCPQMYPILDDKAFVLELLLQQKVLIVQGSGFNHDSPTHFRIAFLPDEDELKHALKGIEAFLDNYRTCASKRTNVVSIQNTLVLE